MRDVCARVRVSECVTCCARVRVRVRIRDVLCARVRVRVRMRDVVRARVRMRDVVFGLVVRAELHMFFRLVVSWGGEVHQLRCYDSLFNIRNVMRSVFFFSQYLCMRLIGCFPVARHFGAGLLVRERSICALQCGF